MSKTWFSPEICSPATVAVSGNRLCTHTGVGQEWYVEVITPGCYFVEKANIYPHTNPQLGYSTALNVHLLLWYSGEQGNETLELQPYTSTSERYQCRVFWYETVDRHTQAANGNFKNQK